MAILFNGPKKSVFIHIPKCGGISLRKTFGFSDSDMCYGKIPDVCNDEFKFAFVRNPFDRIVSAWKMLAFGTDRGHPAEFFNDYDKYDISKFSKFVNIAIDTSIGHSAESTFIEFLRHHCIPMSHPYHCIADADFIGRFENFAVDCNKLLKRLDVDKTLQHHNKTIHDHYSMYYDDKLREIISKFYKADLQKFNYRFEIL